VSIHGITGGALADLAASIPNLPEAGCKGRHQLFDAQPEDMHPDIARRLESTALVICQTCPELEPCRNWFDGLEPHQQPYGVTAGMVRRERRRRRRGGDKQDTDTTDNPDKQTA
jgi:WhiB family redox-sensing transcriptional regulator